MCDQHVHLHSQSVQVNYYLSLCMRKPTIWFSDQVQHKPDCRAEEDRNFRFRRLLRGENANFLTLTQCRLNIKMNRLSFKIMVFLEITGPMKVKFYVGPPCLVGRNAVCEIWVEMLNLAAMLTNAQNSYILLKNRWADFHETWRVKGNKIAQKLHCCKLDFNASKLKMT